MNKDINNLFDLEFRPEWARLPAGLRVHSSSNKPLQNKKPPEDKRDPKYEKNRETDLRRNKRRPEVKIKAKTSALPSKRVPEKNEDSLDQILQHFRISFIPEQSCLKSIIQWLTKTQKAHSLEAVASTFLSKPQYFAVKMEAMSTDKRFSNHMLFQCSICKAVYLDTKEAVSHVLDQHLNLFYDSETIKVDPPKGNFMCVAQCGLSGILLGPPNYHSYNELVAEIQKAHYPHMPIEEYRKHIVNSKDESLLEKWKEDVCHQTHYSALKAPEPITFKQRSEMEQHFSNVHSRSVIRERRRLIIPGMVCLESSNGPISKLIYANWQKELRFPARMGVVLHTAFQRMGLYVFRMPQKKTPFVSAICPKSIDPAQAAEHMRCILEEIKRTPRIKRKELVERLQPDDDSGSPVVLELVSRMCWLIERGHVIEFADGSLVIPHENNCIDKSSLTQN